MPWEEERAFVKKNKPAQDKAFLQFANDLVGALGDSWELRPDEREHECSWSLSKYSGGHLTLYKGEAAQISLSFKEYPMFTPELSGKVTVGSYFPHEMRNYTYSFNDARKEITVSLSKGAARIAKEIRSRLGLVEFEQAALEVLAMRDRYEARSIDLFAVAERLKSALPALDFGARKPEQTTFQASVWDSGDSYARIEVEVKQDGTDFKLQYVPHEIAIQILALLANSGKEWQ